ncbi:MAG: hypothetical protein LC725_07160 [Lentisphaerae bacterium]|nr:hypothetical protein [Lentisphaerota bacterium]
MNFNLKSIKHFISSAYDKLALFLTLIGLLVSVALLLLFLEQEKRALEAAAWERQVTDGQPVLPPDLHELYNAIEDVSERFKLQPRAARMMVANIRTACVQCRRPIPFEADHCPYVNCGVTQPVAQVDPLDKDSSGDGIPDSWKKQHGLDPLADDSRNDLDGDGFTVLEEYLHGADPGDPESHPSPLIKLKLLRIGRRPMPLSFQGIQQMTEQDVMFTVRNNRVHRDYYVRLGDTVEGYKLVDFEPRKEEVQRGGMTIMEDVSRLHVEKDGRRVTLTLGRGTGQGARMAQFLFELDGSRHLLEVGGQMVLKNMTFKVVDIRNDGVVVSDQSSGQEQLIPVE